MPAAAVPQARKSGGGAGLIIGLGIVGLLGALLLAGAGWYFFLRTPAVEIAEAPPTPAPTAQSDQDAPAPPSTSSAIEATPAPSSAATPPPATTAPVVTATPVPAPPPTTTPRPAPPSRQAVADGGGPQPAGRSFLDVEPDEGVDGRAAGEDLAGKYRSGQGYGAGSTRSTTRFRPRERSPRALAPVERPAVATIRHIINAQEAYHRKRNRYGSLSDMASAQSLFLDVPFQAGSFRRSGYSFEVTVESDGFQVLAMPTSPNGRPFIGDDSGFIRVGTE